MNNSDIEFNVVSWYETDAKLDDEDDELQNNKYKKYSDEYVLRLFGRTLDGKSVCARLDNFTPHFYVKVFEHLK